MSRAPVPPSLGAESFSCPHCGALAHQKWFKVIPESFERDAKPHVLTPEVANNVKIARASDDDADEKENNNLRALLTRFAKNEVTYSTKKYSSSSYWEMVNDRKSWTAMISVNQSLRRSIYIY
jgi:hypothetical protein